MTRPASGSAHHQPNSCVGADAEQHRTSQRRVDQRDPRLREQNDVAECAPDHPFAVCEQQHRHDRCEQPNHAGDRRRRAGAGVPGDRGLQQHIEREQEEGASDQAQSSRFTVRSGVGELPDDHDGRKDLDQAVEFEARKCDGAGAPGRDREYANTNDVPGERCILKRQPAPAQITLQRSEPGADQA